MTNHERTDCTARPGIEIRTLGRYEVLIDGSALRFERRAPQRALQLLSLLTTRQRQSTGIGTVSDLLWPESDGYDAQRALTTTLHRLRRLLGAPHAIRLVGGQLWIDPDLCEVDAWKLEHQLRSAATAEELAQALDQYRGPFLGDDPSPWAIPMRERLDRLAAKARRMLATSMHVAPQGNWRFALNLAWVD